MNKSKEVAIDRDAVEKALESAKLPKSRVSEDIERSRAYLGNSINRGTLPVYVVKYISTVSDVPYEDLLAKAEKTEQTQELSKVSETYIELLDRQVKMLKMLHADQQEIIKLLTELTQKTVNGFTMQSNKLIAIHTALSR